MNTANIKCEMRDWGMFLVRLALAIVFIAHGAGKFANMGSTVEFFAMLGIPAFLAYIVAAVELLGGIAMLLGVWTRYAGYAIAVVMLVAIVLVKWENGFFGGAIGPGYELDLTLFLVAIGVSLMGPGKCALQPSGTST